MCKATPIRALVFLLSVWTALPILGGGIPGSRLKALAAYSRSRGGKALLVWENGDLRLERILPPLQAGEPQNLMSGAKNFFAVAVLQAAEDGILDLDEPVAPILEAWKGDPTRAGLRVRHLLQCASGLDPATRELQTPACPDKRRAALGVASRRAPATDFAYGPSHFLILAEVLERRLQARGTTLDAYLGRRLMGPLGLGLATWRRDPAGNLIPYAGLSLTPRQWLAFGRMLLDRGTWGGRALVGPASLDRALVPGPANAAYGFGFWLNGGAARPGALEADVERWIGAAPGAVDWTRACLSLRAPADLFACIGSLGQRLYIVPSRHLVIVHLGRCEAFRDADFLALLFPGRSPVRPRVRAAR
jgi:CubicO group peptidase (beta-lactamase class C family)